MRNQHQLFFFSPFTYNKHLPYFSLPNSFFFFFFRIEVLIIHLEFPIHLQKYLFVFSKSKKKKKKKCTHSLISITLPCCSFFNCNMKALFMFSLRSNTYRFHAHLRYTQRSPLNSLNRPVIPARHLHYQHKSVRSWGQNYRSTEKYFERRYGFWFCKVEFFCFFFFYQWCEFCLLSLMISTFTYPKRSQLGTLSSLMTPRTFSTFKTTEEES